MYQDPIIQKYIELFKANCDANFKSFCQGEPLKTPASDLPVLMVAKRMTRVGAFSNADDEHGVALSATAIIDVRSDLSTTEADREIVGSVAKLYDIMEGRNADYTLKENSLLYILRHNIEVDVANNLRTDLGTITQIDYGFTLKEREASVWTIEARIDFVAHFLQVR